MVAHADPLQHCSAVAVTAVYNCAIKLTQRRCIAGRREEGTHHRSIMAWIGVTYCVLGASAAIAARSGRMTCRACPEARATSRSLPAKLTTAAKTRCFQGPSDGSSAASTADHRCLVTHNACFMVTRAHLSGDSLIWAGLAEQKNSETLLM